MCQSLLVLDTKLPPHPSDHGKQETGHISTLICVQMKLYGLSLLYLVRGGGLFKVTAPCLGLIYLLLFVLIVAAETAQ